MNDTDEAPDLSTPEYQEKSAWECERKRLQAAFDEVDKTKQSAEAVLALGRVSWNLAHWIMRD